MGTSFVTSLVTCTSGTSAGAWAAESFSPSQEVNIITGEQRSRVVAANVKGLLYINECGWLRLVPEDAAKRKNFLFFFLQSQRKDVF